MQDNHQSVELEPAPNAQLNSSNSYVEAPNTYGNASGTQDRLALLHEWQRIIFRHKWLILSLVLIAIPFATIYAYRAKPIYQATTTIDIRPETSSLSKTGDVILVNSNDNTKAEMVIIRSKPVIRKAVVSLNLDKNLHILDNTMKSNLETLIFLKGGQPEQNKLTRKGNISQEDAQKEIDADGDEMKTANSDDESSISPLEKTSETQTEQKRLEPYIHTLLNNLSVEGVRDTRLIRISFRHTDPTIATTVANGVATSFRSYNFETKTDRFSNTSAWLGEETRKQKAKVENAELKLANYSREHNIFSLEGKENLTADKMVRLHDQVMRAEFDRVIKQSLYEEVKQGRVAQLPEAFVDSKTAELRKALNELSVSEAELSVKFGAQHPKLQEMRRKKATYDEQIRGNQSMLEERIKADYERAIREEGSLKSALELAKNDAVQQKQATIQYSILKKELETAKALYTDILSRNS